MMKALFGLEGKRFIVLGGGFGMGEATCNLLADLGADVAVLDIIPERAENVAAQVSGKGVQGLPVICDVLDDKALVEALARTERDWGPLDGMATIVGMAQMGSSIDLDMDIWDSELRRNVRYIYLAAREVARSLIKRGAKGSIASIASVDGIRASTNHAAYGAAKAALVHLAKSFTGEWAQHGIRFNVVAPGAILTPRVLATNKAAVEKMMPFIPMQRAGGIDDVANALVFLLSDLAKYITGQTLAVDGGFTAIGPMDYNRFASANKQA